MVRNIPEALMIQKSFNDALLKISLDTSSVLIGVLAVRNYQFVYLNPRGLDMLRYKNLEELNQYLLQHDFRKEKDSIKDRKERIKKIVLGNEYREVCEFIRGDGSTFWGEMVCNYFEANGEGYILKKLEDITKQKNTEQRIFEAEARSEAIFQYAAIGVLLINEQGTIIMANDHANRLFGYEKSELVGQKSDILVPSEVKERHKGLQNNYINNPKNRPMGIGLDLRGQRKDGSLFPVEISLSHFTEGKQQFFVAFINDATFKKQSEEELLEKNIEIKKLNEYLENEVVNRTQALVKTMQELEKSKQELEETLVKEKELSELKSRFVSMASHEFRTPLTTINSAASLITKFKNLEDQEKREKYVSKIKSAIGNLTDILEEFLSVGKLEEGKIDARYDTFNLCELIEETTSDLKIMLKAGQYFELLHSGNENVLLDKSLLRKIIINLVSNAIKFSSEKRKITIETSVNNYIELIITDYGIGISDEDQKHLFDRFFRGTNVTNIQGTGLGLHIVARYTELMGGEVQLKSKLGEGTTVKIIFPN
jgi:PAS domain S-box-containing protein